MENNIYNQFSYMLSKSTKPLIAKSFPQKEFFDKDENKERVNNEKLNFYFVFMLFLFKF